MTPLTDVMVEDARWAAIGFADLAEDAAQATLAALGLPRAGFEIAILACDDTRIAALNADFRGKPQATNVLSWPSEARGAARDGERPEAPEPGDAADPAHLGDVAIAYETCAAEAAAGGKPLTAHATHLVVHGVLHLLGFEHDRDGDAALMMAFETEILGKMGLTDPYMEDAGALPQKTVERNGR